MTRSSQKGPFVDNSLVRILQKNTNGFKVWSRRSLITPEFVGKQCQVHNGRTFIKLDIKEEMINHKFGEFAVTRRFGKIKKTTKKTRK